MAPITTIELACSQFLTTLLVYMFVSLHINCVFKFTDGASYAMSNYTTSCFSLGFECGLVLACLFFLMRDLFHANGKRACQQSRSQPSNHKGAPVLLFLNRILPIS